MSGDEFEKLKPEDKLGDAPVEEEYRRMLNAIAGGLDEILNPGLKGPERHTGFVIMLFPFGDHSGRCNYISNGADRRDVVVLMKEMVARFEGQPEITGRA